MVPAFLLSLLKQQSIAMGDRFTAKHAHPWLVWEPGAWSAPIAAKETIQITTSNVAGLAQADALSFGLLIGDGKQPVLRIGRNSGNDIVINDATVSRQHALLKLSPPKDWSLEPLANIKAGTHLGSTEVRPGQPLPLRSRDQIRLGEVTLTFYEFNDFLDRLRQHPRAGR
jgi:pSer/pThr/pTyr-binding forkhead associated (FHA) protein